MFTGGYRSGERVYIPAEGQYGVIIGIFMNYRLEKSYARVELDSDELVNIYDLEKNLQHA
jgi:hypothetical protein